MDANMLSRDIHDLMIKFKMEYDTEMAKPGLDDWPLLVYASDVLRLFHSLTWNEQICFSVIYPEELTYDEWMDSEQISARNLMI